MRRLWPRVGSRPYTAHEQIEVRRHNFSPVTYCGVRLTQNQSFAIQADQSEYVEGIIEPSVKTTDVPGELRRVVGSLIWPAHQTRPDLCFDVSSLGSRVGDPDVADLRTAQKLIRRAKYHKTVGLNFIHLGARWRDLVLTIFSDAGWATRPSGHSQGGLMLMLCNPEIAGGKTAKGNVVDYSSYKITLSTVSSYDAELHACVESGKLAKTRKQPWPNLPTMALIAGVSVNG